MKVLAPIGYPSSPSTAELLQWSVLEVEDDDGLRVRLLAGVLGGTETRVRLTSQIEHVGSASGRLWTVCRSQSARPPPGWAALM